MDETCASSRLLTARRPFFHLFAVTTSVESGRHFLLFGRSLSLALTALSIFLVFQVGRLWEYRKVGLLAGLLLLGQPFFLEKTLEMRPDVLALPLFIGSLWMLLRGLARSAHSTKRGLSYFLGGGLSLGAAIMCTQKMLFVLPGALVGLAVWSLAGVTGAATVFTVSNSGDGASGALSVGVSGSELIIANDTCTGASIAVGETCTFSVALKPTSVGAKTGHITVMPTIGYTLRMATMDLTRTGIP